MRRNHWDEIGHKTFKFFVVERDSGNLAADSLRKRMDISGMGSKDKLNGGLKGQEKEQ